MHGRVLGLFRGVLLTALNLRASKEKQNGS